MINLLCISSDVDIITYNMLGLLRFKGYKIYITYSSETELNKIKEFGCIAIQINKLKGKLNFKNIKELRKAIIKYKIDINYCLTSTGLSNALMASLDKKVKTVAYRGTQAKIRITDPTYYLGILNPKVNHVVCETEDIKENLKKYYSEKNLTLNPKPYEIEWIEDAIENPKMINSIPEKAFIVTCIAKTKGRPYKGLTQLINGMNLLDNDNIHLLHIGDYDQSDYDLAKNGRKASQIHFIGFKADAIYYLPNSSTCICPSTRDAAPIALKEAMACGVACIVTDILGARDLVIDKKTGLIISSDSPEEIARALEFMYLNPEKTKNFGIEGKKYLQNKFNMESYLENYDSVFKSLTTNEL